MRNCQSYCASQNKKCPKHSVLPQDNMYNNNFQMPVEDVNSMMQLKQQLSHQINQLNAMLGQNPNMANMMNQGNMNNNMADPGSMIRPNIMLPNYNNMTPNNWNNQGPGPGGRLQQQILEQMNDKKLQLELLQTKSKLQMLLMEQQQQQQKQNQTQLGNPGMPNSMLPGANPMVPGNLPNHQPSSVPFNNLHILQKQLQQTNTEQQQTPSQPQHMMFRPPQQQQPQQVQQNFQMNMAPRGMRAPVSLPAPQPVTPTNQGVRFMPMMPPNSMPNMNPMSQNMMQQVAMMRKQQQQEQARARKLMMAQHRKAALEARLRNKAPQLPTPKPIAVPPTCNPQTMMGGVPPVPMNVSLTATPQGPQFIPKQLPPHTSLPSPIPVPDDKRVPIKTPVPQKAVDPLSLPKSAPSPALPPNTIPWRTPASKVPQPVPASSINQPEPTSKQSTDLSTVNVTIRNSTTDKETLPITASAAVVSKEKNTDAARKTKLVALPSTVPSTVPLTPAITVDSSTLKEKAIPVKKVNEATENVTTPKTTAKPTNTISLSAVKAHPQYNMLLEVMTREILSKLKQHGIQKGPADASKEVTKYLKSMEEAIKRGEFQELSEEVIAAKCTQTCAVQTKLWSDTISDDKEGSECQSEEKRSSLVPSSPSLKQVAHINKIKPPKRKLGRPRKVHSSPIMPALDVMGGDGVVKQELNVKTESVVKTEKGECASYIKHEPMDVVVEHKPVVSANSSQPITSESSGTQVQSKPNNGQNMNIDIENIGNLESLFVMLHKDTDDDSDNIDVNSFLANL